MEAINVDQLSDGVLRQLNEEVAERMGGDCVFICCGMRPPLDDEFRVVIEEIRDQNRKGHLIVVLETKGGFMETVERLVAVMRARYNRVSFVIPNFAYSAGTVLALSGDEIYMDYYSVLGPIDPQYRDSDGAYLPGHGYLAKFQEISRAINTSESVESCRAKLAYLVEKFDPGLLFRIEQGIEHGVSLITEWLPKYKFKDWQKTKTKGKNVTDKMKKDRAKEIAAILGDASKWHSHGRGISMKDLAGPDIKLLITDFGADGDLSVKIKNYHGLAVDYFSNRLGVAGYIHSQSGMRKVL
ncbi:MAG: serine dehydrogenasease [Hyphomonadaceae bacterium]|nr:serine dehydrogenasease [Hyphomonadaceae bacterium]MBC6412689.1 serine dehydrogenasease [Hyphomonadaceae bacterium]